MQPTTLPFLCTQLSTWLMLACTTSLAVAQDSVLWLPANTNAVLAIDVAAAYRSPVAQQNQWAKRAAESFVAQEVFLPPSAKRVTVGTELDLTQSLTPVKQHIVMDLKPGTDLNDLATFSSTEVEPLGEARGMALSGGRYIVQVSNGPLLMESPGGRQAGLRWARSGAESAPRISKLLQAAIKHAGEETPIVVALDLADAVSVSAASGVLGELSGTPLKGATLQAAARVLASVQGATCRVRLGTVRTVECRVEFGESATALGTIALPLLQTVMNQFGASLEDTTRWKSRVDGHVLVYEGEISATGLKHLVSVVRPPVVGFTEAKSATADPQALKVAASRKYLHSVQHEMDELRATLKRTKDNHALWFERAARTIDELPLKNIDEELQNFAARVSSSFRYQAQTERMSKIHTGTRQVQSASTYTTYVGPYGGVYGTVPGSDTYAIKAEGNEFSAGIKFSEWKQIEDGMVQLKQSLTRRYNEDF